MIDRLLERNPRTRRGKLAAEKRLTTVREVGEAWLKGELFAKHGAVNSFVPSGRVTTRTARTHWRS